jgi:methyl-accepting chemotaxis protein
VQDRNKSTTKLSLRLKIAVVIGLALLVMGTVLGYVNANATQNILQREIEKRATALATNLAKNSEFAMYTSDLKPLREFTHGILAQDDVAYVFFVNAKNDATMMSGLNAPDRKGSVDTDPAYIGPPAMQASVARLKLPVNVVTEIKQRTFEDNQLGEIKEVAVPVFYAVGESDLIDDLEDKKDVVKKEARLQGHVQLGFYLKSTVQEINNAQRSSFLIVVFIFIGALIGVVFFVSYALNPIERMALAAAQIAAGDLRQEVSAASSDEVGQLGYAFNDMLKSIRAMIGNMRDASENIESSTNEILSAATQQSAGASEQAASISQTGATVKEINQTAAQTAEKANSVIDIAQRSEEISVVGQKAVEESIAGIEELRGQVEAIAENIIELSERTQQIGEIITTVNDLAEQSNLLALNASIEAAKAGEQGKGFAVVAVEMRNLAEQSKQATAQVRTILSDIQRATRAAVAVTEEGSRKAETSVELANSSGENIRRLAEVIKESSLAAKQIAALANQQSVGIEQISAAMTNIKHSTSEAVSGTKQIERALQDLKSLSDKLGRIVSPYST